MRIVYTLILLCTNQLNLLNVYALGHTELTIVTKNRSSDEDMRNPITYSYVRLYDLENGHAQEMSRK